MVAELLTGEHTVRSSLTNNLTRLWQVGVLERRPMVGRRYIWRVNPKVLQQAA
jgi:hypothetical protein